jgi:hypothetical protein
MVVMSKIMMILIAGGLWANALATVMRPQFAAAADNSAIFQNMENYLSAISGRMTLLDQRVEEIKMGICSNKKICP